MNTTMKLINIIFLVLLTSCGSAKPANKRICTVVKHPYDYLFQVKIENKPLSEQWFLKEDAEDVALDLAKKNRCLYTKV